MTSPWMTMRRQLKKVAEDAAKQCDRMTHQDWITLSAGSCPSTLGMFVC